MHEALRRLHYFYAEEFNTLNHQERAVTSLLKNSFILRRSYEKDRHQQIQPTHARAKRMRHLPVCEPGVEWSG